LGFLVSHRGIEAKPDKIRAIEEIKPPQKLKDIQRLTGCLAALGRFIACLGEKAMPFFKLMKKSGEFKWTPEADEAFATLKRYLTSPPVMGGAADPRAYAAVPGGLPAHSQWGPGGGTRRATPQE
jgi:hypothetical protein